MNRTEAIKKIKQYIEHDKKTIHINSQLAYLWWNVLNIAIFDSQLQKPKALICSNMHSKNLGECIPLVERWEVQIKLWREMKNKRVFITVLAHEMVHQYQWLHYRRLSHGPKIFYNWVPKFKKAGLTLEKYIDMEHLTSL